MQEKDQKAILQQIKYQVLSLSCKEKSFLHKYFHAERFFWENFLCSIIFFKKASLLDVYKGDWTLHNPKL